MTEFAITRHAEKIVAEKGFSLDAVQAVWHEPEVRYASSRHPGQHKRIGGGLCLACDDATGKVITVFVNQTETDLRPDQTDRDALEWAKKRRQR